MKIYNNFVIINGIQYTNTVKAANYSEALKIQRERKKKSGNTYVGRLIENKW